METCFCQRNYKILAIASLFFRIESLYLFCMNYLLYFLFRGRNELPYLYLKISSNILLLSFKNISLIGYLND